MALQCCSNSNIGPLDGFVEGANKVAQGTAIYNSSVLRGHFVPTLWPLCGKRLAILLVLESSVWCSPQITSSHVDSADQ